MALQSVAANEGRIVIEQVYKHLRRQILDGSLPPGTILSQVQLAQQLGVSRTPLREALRLLQEERLVLAEHNHRVRVADINLEELESLYASRIMLEPLALALTIPHFTESDLDALAQTLEDMSTASARHDADAWEAANGRFHERLVVYAEERMRGSIKRSIEASERYCRIKFQTIPNARDVAEAEHAAIFASCSDRSVDAAVELLARHLARSSLIIIAHVDPAYEPTAIRTALRLVAGKSNK